LGGPPEAISVSGTDERLISVGHPEGELCPDASITDAERKTAIAVAVVVDTRRDMDREPA